MDRSKPHTSDASSPVRHLWDWSLAAMEDTSLRRAALTLQDGHGLSASLMLWSAWCERAGLDVADDAAETLVRKVHGMDRYVVRRLREVRRHAGSPRPGFDADALAALRREIYEAELAAERLIMERLERDTLAVSRPGADAAGTGERLARICVASLETPVLLADDLGSLGPMALFARLLALSPAIGSAHLA